jgi:hypothetical protein
MITFAIPEKTVGRRRAVPQWARIALGAAVTGAWLSISLGCGSAAALPYNCEVRPVPGCELSVPGDPGYGVVFPDPANGSLLPYIATPPNPAPPLCTHPDHCG